MSSKYDRVMQDLERTGTGKMKCFGSSMMPILKSGSLLTFKKCHVYEQGDMVFCKVHGRFIDAHKVIQVSPQRGYLIANNHGHQNGWTWKVFGKVVSVE